MTYQFRGNHLIEGNWIKGEAQFASSPATGPCNMFSEASENDVDLAVKSAERAFASYAATTRAERAAFLNIIADEIEARGPAITAIAMSESGLPEARLEGERGRTTGQLRMFAEHILKGDYLDRRVDEALPDRQPQPRPELRMIQRPIGPVAVFGASNFPLAFSTAGGDTAAALAAGCPVVVKGHPAHPGTGEIVAEAIHAAISACGLHQGVFSFVQGAGHKVGARLVQHPLIQAVGFTGSLAGGRALFDLCATRPDPIPFYGELGSVNPMFLMPAAIAARTDEIASGWAGSLAMGAGQFCTNPGVVVMIGQEQADTFVAAAAKALENVAPQTMLTDGIAIAYTQGQIRMSGADGVEQVVTGNCEGRQAEPGLLRTTAEKWLSDDSLSEEVFGPIGIVVVANDMQEMHAVARGLRGQLTCSLHMDEDDAPDAAALMPILERKAGRLLANGFPTGVEVCDAMVHGGPYPASTNFGATSVGSMAIRRFLRPVCYQNMPAALLPDDLQSA